MSEIDEVDTLRANTNGDHDTPDRSSVLPVPGRDLGEVEEISVVDALEEIQQAPNWLVLLDLLGHSNVLVPLAIIDSPKITTRILAILQKHHNPIVRDAAIRRAVEADTLEPIDRSEENRQLQVIYQAINVTELYRVFDGEFGQVRSKLVNYALLLHILTDEVLCRKYLHDTDEKLVDLARRRLRDIKIAELQAGTRQAVRG